METVDISLVGLLAAFSLLIIPLAASYVLQLKMMRATVFSVARMTIQLFLVGIFLQYIFVLNRWWLNLLWLFFMIVAAVFSALNKAKVRASLIFGPILFSFTLATLTILLYFNAFVIRLDDLFSARYLIALGGMLLGNVLSGNIVAINSFYQEIKNQEKFFLYRLAMGATQKEALLPFLRHSFQLALLPALAKTATMGIVSLPGMMTGQILGGATPTTAIKYQIAIMVAIYVAGLLSILFSLYLVIKKSFNDYGVLREGIFKK